MAKAVDHSQRKHAVLSASGAKRWLNCTPSPRLEEKVQGSGSSIYADEGTLAHEFADLKLQLEARNITQKVWKRETDKLRKHELYSGEMEEQVQKYVDYVIERWLLAKKDCEATILSIEDRVDFSEFVPEGFGTCDANIIGDHVLEVNDLKYGKGVKVEAEENDQLKLYAIGAIELHGASFEVSKIKLTIIQPRLDSISTWELTYDDLMSWAKDYVKPQAEKAFKGEGEQKAGDWCRWCRVKAQCPALAGEMLSLAKSEFKDPKLLSLEEVVEAYGQGELLSIWMNAVSEYLLKEALQGVPIPGYKLVEGRSNRAFTDESKIREALGLMYDEKDFTTTKLNGIGAIEKLLGKKNFYPVLGDYVVKPPGKPTLVPESDKRPPMNSIEKAKEEFS